MKKEDFEYEYKKLNNAEDKFKGYVDIFNKEFNLKIKNRDSKCKLLLELAREFLERNYKQTDAYKLYLKRSMELEEEFLDDLPRERKEKFELWQFVEDTMMFDVCEQAFIYGYIVAKELEKELEVKKKKLSK